jgi:hypothetical protein
MSLISSNAFYKLFIFVTAFKMFGLTKKFIFALAHYSCISSLIVAAMNLAFFQVMELRLYSLIPLILLFFVLFKLETSNVNKTVFILYSVLILIASSTFIPHL